MVSSINISKSNRMKLTNNFWLKEFNCNDGTQMPLSVFYRLQKVAIQLQVLRDYLSSSITVNSGYRSPEYNKRIGGVANSQHILGNAADITVKGYTPKNVYLAIEHLINKGEMLQGGLGLYNNFVHYDIGYNGKKRRWNNEK